MNKIIKLEKNIFNHPLKFSICTLVNDNVEYELMKNSFEQNGFANDCEYLIADNTHKNEFDAYEAISHFLKIAKGTYILVVHQDVRVVDNKKMLEACLKNLSIKDPSWAICGNAGCRGYHEDILHISYDSHADLTEGLPLAVNSLDENFLLIKKDSNLTISPNLKGFHLYGTDLCIIANFLGYKAYVIPFMVKHLSKGNLESLKHHEQEFIETYGEKLKVGYIQTTCTKFYISNSKRKNKFYNNAIIFFIVKQFQRYPYLFKKKENKLIKKYVKF